MAAVTLILARWVVPVADVAEDENRSPLDTSRVIENGAVAVVADKIVDVGPAVEVRKRLGATSSIAVVDLSERHVLIPGLVNCHCHLAMTPLRGLGDDLPLANWLHDMVLPAEKELVPLEDYLYEGTRLGLMDAIRGGTTMINDMYFTPEPVAAAVKEAGIRCVMNTSLMDLGGEEVLERQFEVLKKFILDYHPLKGRTPHPLIRPSLAIHSLYMTEERWCKKVVDWLKSSGLDDVPIHVHLNETVKEREFCMAKNNGSCAVDCLIRAGAFNHHTIAAHCVDMPEHDMARFVQHQVNVSHNPKANLKLASGICKVAEMRRRGINVCLGTDGACSNNSLDMISEMQIAALLAKGSTNDSQALDAHGVLRMATLNGAKALGRRHDLGSLEAGKLADMVAVDVVGPDGVGLPVLDPVSHLVYTTHRKVTHVWVNGKPVLDQGQLVSLKVDLNSTRFRSLCARITGIRERLMDLLDAKLRASADKETAAAVLQTPSTAAATPISATTTSTSS